MSRPRTPKPWTSLEDWSEGSVAVVVPDKESSPAEALRHAIWTYTGDNLAVDDPRLIENAKTLRVEAWHYCSKAWMEAEGTDEGYDAYWASNGDGKSSVWVVDLSDIDIYSFGGGS